MKVRIKHTVRTSHLCRYISSAAIPQVGHNEWRNVRVQAKQYAKQYMACMHRQNFKTWPKSFHQNPTIRGQCRAMKGKNRDGWQGGAPARGSIAQDTHCSLASMDVWMDECIWQFDSAEIPLLLTCHIHGLQPFSSLATRGCVRDCLLFCFLDIEYIAGVDCGRPRGGRYPHRSYSMVVEYALCESERSAALRS